MNVLAEKFFDQGVVVQVVQGDLTGEHVDAIVNAANEYLQHGGGVAGAIVRSGGRIIQEESDRVGPVPTGGAAVTSAGKLPCRYIIHAVGPVWQGGDRDEENLLASAVRSAMTRAQELRLESLALPAISSGIFGFPKQRCAEIILTTLRIFLAETNTTLRLIRCTNIDSETAEIFRHVLMKDRSVNNP